MNSYLTSKPAFPWSEGTPGLVAFALVAAVITGLTLWAYSGQPGVTRRRLSALVALRLLALLIAFATALRPSLAVEEDPNLPSVLVIAVDKSESMTVRDEVNSQSRWEAARSVLARCADIFPELERRQNIRVETYQFGPSGFDPSAAAYDPEGRPDADRTDMTAMLARLADWYEGEPDAKRALLVLSDGAANGPGAPPESAADRWQAIAPIRAFAAGKSTTSADLRDLAVADLTADPAPVPIKSEFRVRARVNAPGFAGAKVKATVLLDGKERQAQEVSLPAAEGNPVEIALDAPEAAGEYRLTLRLDALPGEVSPLNNEMESYLTVTKEGLSVLVIDQARLELAYLRRALAADKRVRVYEVIRQTDAAPPGGAAELYQFDRRFYDAIIIGDVPPGRLAAGDPSVIPRIARLVEERGTGLLMTGGLNTFGGTPGVSPGWAGTEVGRLLPVRPDEAGQVEGEYAMVPTEKGRSQYLMRLAGDGSAWDRLNDPRGRSRLSGRNRLGRAVPDATVYARVDDPLGGDPLLVGREAGKGRVLAFAADTTYRWLGVGVPRELGRPVNLDEGIGYHRQFWKQVVLWLARQEETEGAAFVRPAYRRLPVRGSQELAMGIRGKAGQELDPAEIEYRVIGPGEPAEAEGWLKPGRDPRGKPLARYEPLAPGEYRVLVRAKARDADGTEVAGEAEAKFLVYPDVSTELMRPAANHDLLARLEAAADPARANQRVALIDELPQYLREMADQPLRRARPRPTLLPDWRRDASGGFLPGLLTLFVALLGVEWGLRRAWGLA